MQYPAHTWVDPRIEVKISGISGRGLFVSADILEGQTVMIWGGELIPKAAFQANESAYREQTLVPIDDETYIGLPADDTTESIDEYLNHSCDPTAWLTDEVTIVARRHIKAGEEITVDCATWDTDADWPYSEDGRCYCQSPVCRGVLTPEDWMRPELQERYRGHFSPYIQAKIDAAARSPSSTA